MSIKKNFLKVKERIKIAAEKVGKKESDIILVVVGKNRTVEELRKVIKAGAEIIGENRAQELVEKYNALQSEPGSGYSRRNWYKLIQFHFIGHLQTNKVKKIIDKVAMIQSLDSLRLAEELNKRLKTLNKKMPVLIEVNTSKEKNKFGILPKNTLDFIKKFSSFENLKIQGLMTIGKFTSNPQDSRPFFQTLVTLSKQIAAKNFPNTQMQYLSMGMSHDFEVAIEEGANMVRIGRGIFDLSTPRV